MSLHNGLWDDDCHQACTRLAWWPCTPMSVTTLTMVCVRKFTCDYVLFYCVQSNSRDELNFCGRFAETMCSSHHRCNLLSLFDAQMTHVHFRQCTRRRRRRCGIGYFRFSVRDRHGITAAGWRQRRWSRGYHSYVCSCRCINRGRKQTGKTPEDTHLGTCW